MSFLSVGMACSLRLGACVSLALSAALLHQAHADDVPPAATITAAQLKTLLPDERDLQGFVRIRPAFDTPQRINAQPIPDGITVNTTERSGSGRTIVVSGIGRSLYSQNEVYLITMSLKLYASAATAHEETTSFRERAQTPYRQLETDPSSDGETWLNATGPTPSCVLLFRRGRAKVMVRGALTLPAAREGGHQPLSVDSVLALGQMIELRLARQGLLAGIPAHEARVAVNGTYLPPQAAVSIGKRVTCQSRSLPKPPAGRASGM